MQVAHPGITALNQPREGPSLVRPTEPAPTRSLSPVRNRQDFSPTSNHTADRYLNITADSKVAARRPCRAARSNRTPSCSPPRPLRLPTNCIAPRLSRGRERSWSLRHWIR